MLLTQMKNLLQCALHLGVGKSVKNVDVPNELVFDGYAAMTQTETFAVALRKPGRGGGRGRGKARGRARAKLCPASRGAGRGRGGRQGSGKKRVERDDSASPSTAKTSSDSDTSLESKRIQKAEAAFKRQKNAKVLKRLVSDDVGNTENPGLKSSMLNDFLEFVCSKVLNASELLRLKKMKSAVRADVQYAEFCAGMGTATLALDTKLFSSASNFETNLKILTIILLDAVRCKHDQAQETLCQKLSLHEAYVDLVPAFFTESCKWKRDSLAQLLRDCNPNSSPQLLACS